MKKMRKMGFALIVAFSLTLGALPALAEESATDGNAADGTTVTVETTTTGISVTVPLTLPVVGPAEGGQLTTVPETYKLINNSVYPVKVTEVKAALAADTDWEVTTATQSATTPPTEGKVGALSLTLTPPTLITGTGGAKAWTLNTEAPLTTECDWTIAGAAVAEGGVITAKEMLFTLAGSISPVTSLAIAAVDVVKVTYTVVADTNPPATV